MDPLAPPPIPRVASDKAVAETRARIAEALARPREAIERDVARIRTKLEAERQAKIAFTEANRGRSKKWLLRRAKGQDRGKYHFLDSGGLKPAETLGFENAKWSV